MKLTNGKVIVAIGVIHTVATMLPGVFGRQFLRFAHGGFFKINDGFLGGRMDYETFAAFWCFCFGLFLFPLGILLDAVEKSGSRIPRQFVWSYLAVTLVAVYLIPAGGITVFMLPHVIHLMVKTRAGPGRAPEARPAPSPAAEAGAARVRSLD